VQGQSSRVSLDDAPVAEVAGAVARSGSHMGTIGEKLEGMMVRRP
jgi:hypothetical protein